MPKPDKAEMVETALLGYEAHTGVCSICPVENPIFCEVGWLAYQSAYPDMAARWLKYPGLQIVKETP
jgi:hypothetical protein